MPVSAAPGAPKRILVIIYEYPPIGGGGGFGCEKIVRALARRYGHRITVLTAGVGDSVQETTDDLGIRIIRIPCAAKREHRSSATFGFMLNYVIRATCYAFAHRKELACDVLFTHFAIPSGPAGYAISKILKAPDVLTLHGGELFKQPLELEGYDSFIIDSIVRFLINKACLVTANSTDTKNAAVRFLGIRRPIHVINLGFHPPEDCPAPAVRAARQGAVRLVMVSRLVERKGLPYLLEALAGIDSSSWTLNLVGDGPEQRALEAQADRLGIRDRVTFSGFVSEEEKFRILAESDLFVLPTLHEGLGLVYFEAMHCGLPIITTDNGGQTDFLTPEENALLVPIRDVDRLRVALQRGISDAEWRLSCGENNREKIKTLAVDNFMEAYENAFTQAILKPVDKA